MKASEKLSITLPAEMAGAVRAKVDRGAFGSNSEVIREALRGWLEREHRLSGLDAAIARGVADAKAGNVSDPAHVRREMRGRKLLAMAFGK